MSFQNFMLYTGAMNAQMIEDEEDGVTGENGVQPKEMHASEFF